MLSSSRPRRDSGPDDVFVGSGSRVPEVIGAPVEWLEPADSGGKSTQPATASAGISTVTAIDRPTGRARRADRTTPIGWIAFSGRGTRCAARRGSYAGGT